MRRTGLRCGCARSEQCNFPGTSRAAHGPSLARVAGLAGTQEEDFARGGRLFFLLSREVYFYTPLSTTLKN